MSAPQFTPGPWRYDRGESPGFHEVTSESGDIAYLTLRDTEAEANARLIAAAPDLFEACEGVLARFESGENLSSLEAEWLRAALAKARGEQ